MSKQLTPLEALNDLREVKGWNDNELNKRLDIIETALKYQKEHKALEIIKENIGLKMSIDEDSGDEDTACLYVPLDKDNICIVGYVKGKEKIDLLKEVLK